MNLPAWTREPLVHFLFAGALLYGFFALSGANSVDPSSRVIEVDRDVQAQLALQFERSFGRAPSDAELDAQIERFVREEVLYREALRLGLDRGDAVVRRRLVTKMDIAASAAAEAAVPTREKLEAWRKAHPERFAEKARFTFDQIYFADRSKAMVQAKASEAQGANWRERGDPISLPSKVEKMRASEVANRFGERFLEAISKLDPSEEWTGPITSGFGWHLVRLREVEKSRLPPLAQIREQVENDWRSELIAERKKRAYAILRDAYRVEIDR